MTSHNRDSGAVTAALNAASTASQQDVAVSTAWLLDVFSGHNVRVIAVLDNLGLLINGSVLSEGMVDVEVIAMLENLGLLVQQFVLSEGMVDVEVIAMLENLGLLVQQFVLSSEIVEAICLLDNLGLRPLTRMIRSGQIIIDVAV
ncbi:hypothetical protein FN846DRAFT_907876 [Sphaerosporella brunnea]|uniref:Uncharacterized protein n=1 Tax=Sphaerosporella brunnea TaxID=1250544 RepID=A0A5J5EVR7_9PEZI|nr:hypothetical protein FN846DRAFT_907876 [Sphaerosporella brunnea]